MREDDPAARTTAPTLIELLSTTLEYLREPRVPQATATLRTCSSVKGTGSSWGVLWGMEPLPARNPPPRRLSSTARISATIDSAISAEEFAPMSRPAGE